MDVVEKLSALSASCDDGTLVSGPEMASDDCLYFSCRDENGYDVEAKACPHENGFELYNQNINNSIQTGVAACLGYACVDARAGWDSGPLPTCLPVGNLPPWITVTSPGAKALHLDGDGRVELAWLARDPDDRARIQLRHRRVGHAEGWVMRNPLYERHGGGRWSWLAGELPAGSYYVVASIHDGRTGGRTVCSQATVEIEERPCITSVHDLVPRCIGAAVSGYDELGDDCIRVTCASEPPLIVKVCPNRPDTIKLWGPVQWTGNDDLAVCLDYDDTVKVPLKEVACLRPRVRGSLEPSVHWCRSEERRKDS